MKTPVILLGTLCLAVAGCSTHEHSSIDPNLLINNQAAPPNAVILPTNSVDQKTPPSIVAPANKDGGNPSLPPR